MMKIYIEKEQIANKKFKNSFEILVLLIYLRKEGTIYHTSLPIDIFKKSANQNDKMARIKIKLNDFLWPIVTLMNKR
jgi:hypothetical protein